MGWVAESNCWLAEVGLESVEGWVMEGLQRVNTILYMGMGITMVNIMPWASLSLRVSMAT